VTFLDAYGRELGDMLLPTIGPREREGKTGLLPVESNNVIPAGTAMIRVNLTFSNKYGGLYHRVYADNLVLTLVEYSRRITVPKSRWH
jgi:hypothetical protein